MSLHKCIYFIIKPYYLKSIKNSSQTQDFGFIQKSWITSDTTCALTDEMHDRSNPL